MKTKLFYLFACAAFMMPCSTFASQQSVEENDTTFATTNPVDSLSKVESKKPEVFEVACQSASFPGGDAKLYSWLSQNLKYPVSAQKDSVQGRVIVQMVIDRDGLTTDVKIAKSLHPDCDAEVVRLVQSMPKWIPARGAEGQLVRQRFVLPITFSLPSVKKK